MNAAEASAFLYNPDKSLPAQPEWRQGNRTGEWRATLPIAVGGAISGVNLVLTVRTREPGFLMAALLADRQICRLCMTTGHRDRASGLTVQAPHFHRLPTKPNAGAPIPKLLHDYEMVPAGIVDRDNAFVWFLGRTGILIPSWMPVKWPAEQVLL